MPKIIESDTIAGLQIVELPRYGDERGIFQEIFRREWFPQVAWDALQSNCSHSKAHVLRGLHYHFKQVDYWYVPKGRIQAGLVDLRPNSPSFKAHQLIEMGEENHLGLFIPIGVAHGFYAHTECSLIYFVNHYYDSQDEFGIAWNDPEFPLDWATATPLISERDKQNRPFAQVPHEQRPK